MSSILQNIQTSTLQQIALPVLAEVQQCYLKPERGGYCVDAEVLTAGNLDKTGEYLKEVPISPIWAGSNGQGVYAPLDNGQIVVVLFIQGSRAFPFVAGVWSDEYEPAQVESQAFTVTDGQNNQLELKEQQWTMQAAQGLLFDAQQSTIILKNSHQSLATLTANLLDILIDLTTQGAPSTHALSPNTIVELTALKERFNSLLGE